MSIEASPEARTDARPITLLLSGLLRGALLVFLPVFD